MVTKLRGYVLLGVHALDVDVEVDVSGGMPAFDVVGLPDKTVSESRNRVKAAIRNSGFSFPTAQITVNLTPAEVRKIGSNCELPILLGVLLASRQLRASTADCAFIGAMSLSGAVLPVNGVLPMVLRARESGVRRVFVPEANAFEVSVVDGVEVLPVGGLLQIIELLEGRRAIEPQQATPYASLPVTFPFDYSEVKGQAAAVRALEIAAAGGHNILMIGPPGTGKSMLAKRLPSILPDMTFGEAVETSEIHSVAGLLDRETPIVNARPFRAPHFNVSTAGLIGGGPNARPGEISLAHNGVLFLDELPEYKRDVKEALRQPLEDGHASIVRAAISVDYPSSFMLVAAMNPCPCGYLGHPTHPCSCASGDVRKYLDKVSGPLIDRVDMQIEVNVVDYDSLAAKPSGETSASIRARVAAARTLQRERYAGRGVACNARIPPGLLLDVCPLTDAANAILKGAFERMGLNPRSHARILQVARTIADLDRCEVIGPRHIAEAVQYRALERKYWGGSK